MRSATVSCLATFMELRQDHRNEILSALLLTLERNEHPVLQAHCYRVLLKELGIREEIENIPHQTVRDFRPRH